MNKYLIFGLTLAIGCSIVLAEEAISSKFINALQNCSSSYSESGSFTTDGTTVNSSKRILGWQNGKCVYQEKVKFSDMNSCVTCRFSKSQLSELASVMRSWEVVQSYSAEEVDYSKSANVQNNPVVKVWNKYLQDSSVCTVTLN